MIPRSSHTTPEELETMLLDKKVYVVFDGGALLMGTSWPIKIKFGAIINMFVIYVKKGL